PVRKRGGAESRGRAGHAGRHEHDLGGAGRVCAGVAGKVKENTMGKVAFGLSVSLDGFIAGKHDDVSEVFAWMGRAMEQFHEVMGGAMGEKRIALHGASAVQQALQAGLLDE